MYPRWSIEMHAGATTSVRPRRGWPSLAFGCLFGVLLLSAALGKAWDFDRFARVVDYVLEPIAASRVVVAMLGSAVLFCEVFLGLYFVCGVWRRGVVLATAIMLAAFSVVLYRLASDPVAPDCGCLGLLKLLGEERGGARAGLVRNGALLVVLAWMFANGSNSTVERTSRGSGGATECDGGGARGFTLVELLVAIVVLAILIVLMLPALSRAKESGVLTRSMAMHRQLIAVLSVYADDHVESFPYFATAGEPDGPKVIAGFDVPGPYFRVLEWHWASLLVPAYLSAEAIQFPDWSDRRQEWGWPTAIVRSPFFLSDTVFAAPRYWYDDDPPEDLSLLRATRWSEVLFPAEKGLLVDVSVGVAESSDRKASLSIGVADGSATLLPWLSVDWTQVVERPFGASPFPVYSTRKGLHAAHP
jgi:prepilin-type N-terminal cleavage/methylation domain-containing protein